MRHLTYVVPVALLSLVTACGSSSTPTTTSTTAAPGGSSSPTSPSSGSPSSSPDDKGGAAGEVLTGTLAPNDGFKIFLKDKSGKLVTTLKAGKYEVKISDTSTIHNLHLKGPGGVDLKTTVPQKLETSWPVTLTAGSYKFVCDPHANMVQTFTVT